MKLIKTSDVRKLIESTNGTFFSVVFVKKDGSDRHMVCRKGVSKGVNGSGLKYNPKQYGLICVRDVQKKAHRMISIDTIKTIQIKGDQYTVCD